TLDTFLSQVGGREVFGTLAELNPDAAVFVVDGDRKVLYWNEGAEQLLGYRADEALGNHCLKVNRCRRCMMGCDIKEKRLMRHAPLILYARNDEPIPLRKSGRAFFDEDGNFLGGIEVLRHENPVSNRAHVEMPALGPSRFPAEHPFFAELRGDAVMHPVLQACESMSAVDLPFLLSGPRGTGKERLAQAVHSKSHRRDKAFVSVDCARLLPKLQRSELFGHVKGAFVGAASERRGALLRADGGTLFLSEMDALASDTQDTLLQVLDRGEVTRLGSAKSEAVDVRLVMATCGSPRGDRGGHGGFAEEFVNRSSGITITLPSLRERRASIPRLLDQWIERHNRTHGRRIRHVDPEAMRALLQHDWPENVSELRAAVEYALSVCRGETLTLDDLPPELTLPQATDSDPDAGERRAIQAAVDASGGHLGEAAERLGVSRPTLWRKRKRLGME
ncbi:MAG: sigma 54-interacting transcriptional regulator, partial [Myxococcota bacterium]